MPSRPGHVPGDQPGADTVLLAAPRYVLGENIEPHDRLADLSDRTSRFGMLASPELWGWGEVRRTDLGLDELAVRSGRLTLAAAGVKGDSVDALVLCSTRFPGGAECHGGFVERIAAGLDLRNPAFYGLTLHRCANLLAAVGLARTLVLAGVHGRVLVVTTDRIEPVDSRVEQYALFSDGAASCLVTAGTDEAAACDSYEIVSCASARDLTRLDWSNEISVDLARAVNLELLSGTGLRVGDLRALLHANLVTPLVVMKERQAGFTSDQMYLGNIARFGHCFAADPLINLVDRGALGHLTADDHVALAISVPGERFAVLLRCRLLTAAGPVSTDPPADLITAGRPASRRVPPTFPLPRPDRNL